jgi:Questin oxidase-like
MAGSEYDVLDEALAMLAASGPEFDGGLSNHGPMAAEALCALGRPDAVVPWVTRYRRRLAPKSAARSRIAPDQWRASLGEYSRAADWSAFFANELEDAPWRDVLARWVARLAPGIVAAATHGVIRTGHAARALAHGETTARRSELGEGLAYWAAAYRELPGRGLAPTSNPQRAARAIESVVTIPRERRGRNFASIDDALRQLDTFEPFRDAIGLIDTSGDVGAAVSEVTATFARIYLANADQIGNAIAFIHCVTGNAAVRNLAPFVDDATTRAALRYGWQAAAGIYAVFGRNAAATVAPDAAQSSRDDLIARAIATGDEHAIKFTEVCLREHALAPEPGYLAAANHAIALLGSGRS